MIQIILVIHLLIALAMIGIILLQRSEGGVLGIGGGGGGMMSGRAAGNLLTRTTGFLAAAFFATSLLLAILASNRVGPTSIIDDPALAVPSQPDTVPAEPAQPAVPTR